MSRKQKLGSFFLSTISIFVGVFLFLTTPTNIYASIDTTSVAHKNVSDDLKISIPRYLYDSNGKAIDNSNYSIIGSNIGVTNYYNTSNIQALYPNGQTGARYLNENTYSISDGKTIAIYVKDKPGTGTDSYLLGVITNAQSTDNSVFHQYKTLIPKSDATDLQTAINSVASNSTDPNYNAYASLNTGSSDSSVTQLQNNVATATALNNRIKELQDEKQNYMNESGGSADPAQLADYDKQIATLVAQRQAASNNVESAAGSQLKAAQTAPGPLWCVQFSSPFVNPPGCLAQVGQLVLKGSSWILWGSANLFDKSLDLSLNFKNIVDSIPMVTIGWKIFRDVTNIFFIFILLMISIGIIIDKAHIGNKSMIAGVLTAALLINFSLFFTQVIIDGSNILALQFYGEIRGDPSAHPADASGTAGPGISQTFVQALDLTTIYQAGPSNATDKGVPGLTLSTNDPWNVVIVTFGGSILILVTAFVFLAAAALFIMRSLILITLMVTAPVAYMAQALPNSALKDYANRWWKRLTNECLFAPVYMMMTYILVSAISSKTIGVGVGKGSFASLFSGDVSYIGTAFSFFLIIGFMVSTLTVAKSLGATGADTAISYGKIASNATKNWVVRNTAGTVVGQVGNRLANSAVLSAWAGSSVGRALGGGAALRTANRLSNAKIGGQSYSERIKEKQATKDETAKLIENRVFRRRGLLESEETYARKQKEVADSKTVRANNVQGIDENGKPIGFLGFTHSERQATLLNQRKAMKGFKSEKDKETLRAEVKEKTAASIKGLLGAEVDEKSFNLNPANKGIKYDAEKVLKDARETYEKDIAKYEEDGTIRILDGEMKVIMEQLNKLTTELAAGKYTPKGQPTATVTDNTRALALAEIGRKTALLETKKANAILMFEKMAAAHKKEEEDKLLGAVQDLTRATKASKT